MTDLRKQAQQLARKIADEYRELQELCEAQTAISAAHLRQAQTAESRLHDLEVALVSCLIVLEALNLGCTWELSDDSRVEINEAIETGRTALRVPA